jgi:hypothetical protein
MLKGPPRCQHHRTADALNHSHIATTYTCLTLNFSSELAASARRTRTLVSTARIALSGVAPDAVLQLIERPRFGRLCSKYGLMDILGTEAACTTDDDVAAFFVPFEEGAWANAKLSAYGGRNRNPSFCRNPRPRNRHTQLTPEIPRCGRTSPRDSLSIAGARSPAPVRRWIPGRPPRRCLRGGRARSWRC